MRRLGGMAGFTLHCRLCVCYIRITIKPWINVSLYKISPRHIQHILYIIMSVLSLKSCQKTRLKEKETKQRITSCSNFIRSDRYFSKSQKHDEQMKMKMSRIDNELSARITSSRTNVWFLSIKWRCLCFAAGRTTPLKQLNTHDNSHVPL